ncbi:hypothetical protein SDC9_56457 [bioreactor metagenome]|uniref:Helicase ATP-binding domain-containing protein n=1 Tax=bioreactor metagenome TaxID=1076179 RepID=A0A644X762_9ZZZZ
MSKKSLKNLEHYVKIMTGRRREWLRVDLPKGCDCSKASKQKFLTGHSVMTGKEISFHPDDVLAFYVGKLSDATGLGMPYIPAAEACNILDTVVPDSMGYETHIAARIIELKLGRPLNEYVAEKLHYNNLELCKALSAEQVDAVAMAIYNIEQKGQGMIIGDQTGIGKGRVAASMIRYGKYNGLKPIFLSEKPNLFTDIYRDLVDTGSGSFVPFIVNGKEAKTDIKDNEGNVVYSALAKEDQERIFKAQKFPSGYDFVCATYSQFNSVESKPTKPNFLRAIAQGNLIIMDEAHNASGSSNTGNFLQEVIIGAKGCVFLSATFAKRPDNMPIYALKTCISEANMSKDDLIAAIIKGGVALQEVIAAQLVSEGQMIRRERSFEGVEVNYIVLTEKEQEHKATFDNITAVLRDIISFQTTYIDDLVSKMDKVAAAEGKEAETRKGTKKAGVDNSPYFSKVFQVINQLLFSLKARSVAEMAIERLAQGKKPIIAFSSTMETFLDEMGDVGDTIDLDFRSVLTKGLDGILRYTITDTNGKREGKYFTPAELGVEASTAYFDIVAKINKISTGITISPIDIIKDVIRSAGYSCDEVTGRKYEVQMIDGTNSGVLLNRKKILANDAFRQFNNNELDCLLINQSGSTGASAHAIVTPKVPREEVKQRVMLVLQAELDINREVQKRGRINRTGQILKPIYDYVSSCIPAERRLMMMLRKKLKSLDANTTSNQKQSENVLKSDDFLNKYGDHIVKEYLLENPVINKLLDDPLDLDKENKESANIENAASKVSGRVAVLSTEDQELFYVDMLDRYNDYVNYLKQADKYDLEVETMNLESETLEKVTIIEGKSGTSVFSENTFQETCEVNVLKKPFTRDELQNLIKSALKDENPFEQQNRIQQEVAEFYQARLAREIEDVNKKHDKLISDIDTEKKFMNLQSEAARAEYRANRRNQIEKGRETAIEMEQDKSKSKIDYINRILKFYYCGRMLKYPTAGNSTAMAVCVGFGVDTKKPNPYAPSAMKVKIAVANSNKYIDLSLAADSGKLLNEIIGLSYAVSKYDQDKLFDNWEYAIKNASTNRRKAIIITGNILQAYTKFDSGKLISFTTKDGSVRKGILLPENFDPEKSRQNGFVTVPILKAVKYILQMPHDNTVSNPDGKIVINHYAGRSGMDYYLSVPANKNFKHIFEDLKIIKLSLNPRDGFEKRSDKMIAFFSSDQIPALLAHLDERHSIAVIVSNSVYSAFIEKSGKGIKVKSDLVEKAEKKYEEDKQRFESRKSSGSSPAPEPPKTDLNLLKLKMRMKAAALKLEE